MNEIPYERVKIARDNGRPTGTDYIKNIFKNYYKHVDMNQMKCG